MTDTHRYVLVNVYETNAQMYQCPICDRRILFADWVEPKLITLTPGDQNATHTGGNADPLPWQGEGLA